jgi:hypothetical protein
MQIGFGKVDITPRVGVELCGFGPHLHRYSVGVRDRLEARAMAVREGNITLVLISCDLVGFPLALTREIRRQIHAATGISADQVMVHGTHTHSGPNTIPELAGWGALDEPYLAILPGRVASAGIEAVSHLEPATLAWAEVPCIGVSLNREYDRDAPPLEEVLREDWRPAKPEHIDTTCQVLKAVAKDGRLLGFASYFGCHPVVCCQQTRWIHGDFAGVSSHLIERENPGAVGLFLQGALGDINSCVVHKPEAESLAALDVIAERYARAVRAGLAAARPVAPGPLGAIRRELSFSRIQVSRAELERLLAEQEAVFTAPGASDTDDAVRMAAVKVAAYRKILAAQTRGENLNPPTELQGFRIGPVSLLGTPFEIFHAVKEEALPRLKSEHPLILGLTNDELGYAPDRATAIRGGYAAQQVPLMLGRLPFAAIHDELVSALVELEGALPPKQK